MQMGGATKPMQLTMHQNATDATMHLVIKYMSERFRPPNISKKKEKIYY